ncbi:MAG: cold-shock protein [Betaproteobacteria bacterium HGW-Betaproteobacteria-18]|nr:MAG: cold-shock protein [Betaproteobacteria bacterium HGW-Betaproteobacteria-18]
MLVTRYEGKLKKWNSERGFGFICANDSGQDIFVHISAFPCDGQQPLEGELLSFEVEPDGKGKKHAVRVRRVGASQSAKANSSRTHVTNARHLSRVPKTSAWPSKLITLVLLAALAWYGYSRYASRVVQIEATAQSVDRSPAPVSLFQPAQPAPSSFNCDGRKRCSQMTSCKEATLFLQNCPGMEMDGNHDGVPCEQQWCTTPFAD